ncbi:unnamed protein product [Allacma fusca]|uniref:DNA primase large subunit n=1 Tax=Allacma fusca TaxID=39272 RepID=A0A8J2KKD6_9HEXA|nr:unnamed protein product [Allacma fusca]
MEIEQEFSTSDFNFFLQPPDCSVSLQQFEEFAVSRLKLLRILERISLTTTAKDTKDWKEKIDQEISQAGLTEFQYLVKTCTDHDMYRQSQNFDHISHYILRLAFCRTEELRRWFVNQEIEFLRYKFMSSGDGKLAKKILDAHFQDTVTLVGEKDKSMLAQDLADTYFYLNKSDTTDGDVYEVPFTQCLDLVRTRRVLLKNGKAYIFHTQLLTIVCSEFRRLLSKDLTATSKMMPIVDEDERLAQIINDFDKRHTGSSYAPKGGTVTDVVTVEKLEHTQGSFPLCVKSLYDHVKKEHHLRHHGRLQLGLFFKGVGVPLEEATRFWRTHFTKKQGVDDNRFDKQYLYNIRHMYGQEGKRANYTPYSCMKIIMTSVSPGESHGCPFRHSDGVSLRVKLAEANIPATGVKEIMELVEKHHYQIACQRYFEWTHNKATVEGGVNHPNQYYGDSLKAISGSFKIKTEVTKVPTQRVNVYLKKELKEEDVTMELDKCDDNDEIYAALDDSVDITDMVPEH